MKITLNNLQDVYRAKLSSQETMELKGHELVKEFFVDSSGLGSSDEPALTTEQFNKELEALIRKEGSLTAKITGRGLFQVYVGLFKKTGKNKTKKIANNTYRIDYGDKEAIRLHNTDILIFEADHISIYTGGWQTRTTKERINRFLPSGVYIEQKNYDWYIHDCRDNTVKDFYEGITIPN